MTENQIELKNKVVEEAMGDPKNLNSWEIDFVESMDNLAENIALSPAQDSALNTIANKLGIY